MGYANAVSTADLEIKINKQVHDEITQLMCADAAYRNRNHNQEVPALETEQALSTWKINTPSIKQAP